MLKHSKINLWLSKPSNCSIKQNSQLISHDNYHPRYFVTIPPRYRYHTPQYLSIRSQIPRSPQYTYPARTFFKSPDPSKRRFPPKQKQKSHLPVTRKPWIRFVSVNCPWTANASLFRTSAFANVPATYPPTTKRLFPSAQWGHSGRWGQPSGRSCASESKSPWINRARQTTP